MTEAADFERASPGLTATLEEAAADLVLGGVNANLAAQFSRLSEQADAEGLPNVSRAASALSERIGPSPKSSPELETSVTADLAQLRSVIESELEIGKSASNLSDDPELIGDFILEAREHLDSIEGRVLALEQNPGDIEIVHAVFRSFHTIKGLAGFLEMVPIRDVAHEVETYLGLARDGKLRITPAMIDGILESTDYLQGAVSVIEASLEGDGERLFAPSGPLISKLQRLDAGDALFVTPASFAAPKTAQPEGAEASSVRVETAKLDYLMEMVGELVIAQSLLRHNSAFAANRDPRLLADFSQLARTTAEVQRTTMNMRMIPMAHLFHRTGRLVRDLSRKAGKQVELEMSGEETELDKTIAEELSDPLMHMMRNAIDHGIEKPEERNAAGKGSVAHVRLAAYHQGGQIVIAISDDGRGLDREKILHKAQRNGLVEGGVHLSDHQVFDLIFEPGFSTAEQITDVSGRGVGMDVVRKHVQKLRGRIDIESTPGQGTTFLLRLPLTLAIIEGLIVRVGAEQYVAPIFAIKEILRPLPDSISTVNGKNEMALVRGRLLPVVRLHRYFGVVPRSENAYESLLLVAECQGKNFCLMVDELAGKQEVVIKSLSETLKNIPGIAGGAILGDGKVGLILDIDGVYRRGKP